MLTRVALLAAIAAAGVMFGFRSSEAASTDTLSITPPADITVVADSVCGQSNCAAVTFSFTVTGGTPPYHLVCNFYSGDLFLVGTHTVTCFAQDSVGNSTPPASFQVTVNPGGPPPPPPPPPPATLAITAPADITAVADSVCNTTPCKSVAFSFNVTGGYPPYNLVCNFYSGNLFLLGPHTVSCIAQDSRGDSTPSASFTVTVTAPPPATTTTTTTSTGPTTTSAAAPTTTTSTTITTATTTTPAPQRPTRPTLHGPSVVYFKAHQGAVRVKFTSTDQTTRQRLCWWHADAPREECFAGRGVWFLKSAPTAGQRLVGLEWHGRVVSRIAVVLKQRR